MAMDAGDSSDPYCKIALGKDVSRNGRNTQITCQLPHGWIPEKHNSFLELESLSIKIQRNFLKG